MPESNTDSNKKFLSNIINHEKWKEEFYNKTIHQLKTEERFVNYFKQFDPGSVESFIKSYASKKVNWFSAGNNLKQWEQSRSKQWIKDCFVALVEIQQKKLFNAQCLWRAEKLQLPAIAICYDFKYWQDHIFAFPDIPPVTDYDIEFYSRYLRETPCNEPFDSWGDYQDYEEMISLKRESGNAYENQPYFRFYDENEGTASYLDLPDIRSAKEEVYIDIARKDYQEKSKLEEKTQNKVTQPYFIDTDYKLTAELIKRHETPAFYRMYQQHIRNEELNELNETPEYNISRLEDIPLDYLAIEPADDWRIAVNSTYERYRRERIIENLPHAFAIYLKHRGHDWKYPGRSDYHELKIDPDRGLSKIFLDMIIKGRILNGEPADLNF